MVWFIVAQVFGLITIGFEFISYQIKDKRKYLLVNGIGSAFWAVMFVAMGLATSMSTQMSLIIVAAYSSARALVFWWIFKKDTPRRRKAGRIFLGCMIAIALTAGIIVIVGLPTRQVQIFQVFALVFALGFVIGQYMPGKHPVRIAVLFYAIMLLLASTPINILYAEPPLYFRWNPMGMAIEAAKIASVFVFYFLLFQKKRMAKRLEEIKRLVSCEVERVLLENAVEVKKKRLESLPIPKLANIQSEMKEVILGGDPQKAKEEQ